MNILHLEENTADAALVHELVTREWPACAIAGVASRASFAAELNRSAYDLVLADPPYSVEDADHYQTTMVKRNVVMRALQRLPKGAHVVWLDQVLPMYRKDAFAVEGVIGMVKSTNHRFRVVTVFGKV